MAKRRISEGSLRGSRFEPFAAVECVHAVLEAAPEALGWRDRAEGNANLAHLAAQRRDPAMLDALVQHGADHSLFAEKRGHFVRQSERGFTPAQDCANGYLESVSARAECWRVLHKGLVQHFSPLLATLESSAGSGFSFAPALSDAIAAVEGKKKRANCGIWTRQSDRQLKLPLSQS